MSEMEMKNEVETEEFTDVLSDECLDREGPQSFAGRFSVSGDGGPAHCHVGN
jgi:hypothetical protein